MLGRFFEGAIGQADHQAGVSLFASGAAAQVFPVYRVSWLSAVPSSVFRQHTHIERKYANTHTLRGKL